MSSETKSSGTGWVWAVVIIGGLIWFFNYTSGDTPAPASTSSTAELCENVLAKAIDDERHGTSIDDEVIGDFSSQCTSSFTVFTDYISAKGSHEQGLTNTCDELAGYGLTQRSVEYLAADGYCSTEPTGSSGGSGWVSWTDARSVVGTSTTVCGPVVNVTQAFDSTGQPTFLDIGAAYPDTASVSVVIWDQYRANFPAEPAEMYHATDVCVSGDLYTYEGLMQIESYSASQIAIQ